MIHNVEDILTKLENCIKYRLPFSHIRFGDGGIKFIDAALNADHNQMRVIVKKEGLPTDQIAEIFELWGYYARHADFIDTPEVYFNDTFWPRIKKLGKKINEETKIKMLEWETLYHSAEFDNDNYCNPESNYLMILRRPGRKNLIDLMKDRRICLITAKPEVRWKISEYNIDIVEIVGHYENQYKNSFKKVVDIIKNTAKEYDFWMVAAGELGRLYSGIIKKEGGRTVDIGFVAEFWTGEQIHPRLRAFMNRSDCNPLELKLTELGLKYDEHI